MLVRFKRAWRSGAHAVVLDPLDFIARRVALIPPPHFNMVRYHGVLAARAKARAEVVAGPSEEPEPAQLRLVFDAKAEPGVAVEVEIKRSSRHPWAWLLRRVFAVDVLTCERCEGRMRLVELANEPEEISRVLAKVGLGPRPPPRRRPALPGQLELKFVA
ncbi:putative transposase [Enhygromyxa salina]|uniref:Putative transposase n=1 Tax=Enhygromyxa salina TaxID=215803 RepID=A0A2S9XME0_9BACT|nr:putative transposase [Enhygromyxa salina]